MLYRLSYVGAHRVPFLERETGLEPATNSLEGCDSTTELLPREHRLSELVQADGFEPP